MYQKLETKQSIYIGGKTIESLQILQFNTQELEQYVQELALENPMIELQEQDFLYTTDELEKKDEQQRKLEWLESYDGQNKVFYEQDKDDYGIEQKCVNGMVEEDSLGSYLHSQLLTCHINDNAKRICEYLILLLDDSGYLYENADELATRMGQPLELITEAMQILKGLEPAGVGASSLSECLLLQLKRMHEYPDYTEDIIERYLDKLGKNHIHVIAKELNADIKSINAAVNVIKQMNPKPGNIFSTKEIREYITPDVFVVKMDSCFEIILNDYHIPHFHINDYYKKMEQETTEQDVKDYLCKKRKQADWLKKCIEQRNSTLSRVTGQIVKEQKAFFVHGIHCRVPLTMQKIAFELNLHESTVSRAVRDKYLQCSWGVFPLSHFFLDSIKYESKDDMLTTEQAKQMIRDIIDRENKEKPFSDQKISEQLQIRGVQIARRTVTKYREQMGIPDKSGRKKWG